MDLKGLNMWPDPRAISIFKEFLRIVQDYYPETLGTLFFVNAPLIFTALWRMIKGMLDPATSQKIRIFGAGFEAALRELVEPGQLLREYGGTNAFNGLSEECIRSLADCVEWAARVEAQAKPVRVGEQTYRPAV